MHHNNHNIVFEAHLLPMIVVSSNVPSGIGRLVFNIQHERDWRFRDSYFVENKVVKKPQLITKLSFTRVKQMLFSMQN